MKAKLCALTKAEQSSKSAWLAKEILVLLQLNTSSKSNILMDSSTVIFLTKFDFSKSKTKLQSITSNKGFCVLIKLFSLWPTLGLADISSGIKQSKV